MERTFLELTPKRKSILWNYKEDGTAYVVAVRNEKLEKLRGLFKNESPKTDIEGSDGFGISLNLTGTKIWENCDGISSVSEIIDILNDEFNVEKEEALSDLKDFLYHCNDVEILDLEWRCML